MFRNLKERSSHFSLYSQFLTSSNAPLYCTARLPLWLLWRPGQILYLFAWHRH